MWVKSITKQMAMVSLEEGCRQGAKRHQASPVPPYLTWAQIKNLTWKAEDVFKKGNPQDTRQALPEYVGRVVLCLHGKCQLH